MDRTLLLVDDEASLIGALKRDLRSEGYRLLTASSGDEALRILAENEVHVVLSDYRMARMTGVELLAETRRLYPDTVRMVLSGYADLAAIVDAINRGHIYKFLNKPWDGEQLRTMVSDAFAQYDLICRGAQFSRIFETTREGIFILGADAAIRSANPAFCGISGHTAAELAGQHLDLLQAGQVEQASIATVIEAATRDGHWSGERWFQRKSGEAFPAALTLTTLRNANARVTQYVGLCNDITERKQREMALLESEKRFRDFMEFAPIGMLIVALDGRLLKANQALCQILGFSREELESMNFADLAVADDLAADLVMRRRLLLGEATVWQTEKRYLRKDGSTVWVQLTASLLRDTHGAPQCFDAQVEDITERHQHQDQIRQLAYFDALTGLPNRRLLQERLEQALTQAQRKGCMSAVLFLDLDHFKQVNDSRGHEIGDQLLQAAAQRLSNCVRSGDTVARQGGDEFIIVLPDFKAATDAELVARKIVAALAAPYELTAAGLTIDVITASVGLAVFPRDGVTAQDLMKHADAAMYAAKDSGRNGYRCYDETLPAPETRAPDA